MACTVRKTSGLGGSIEGAVVINISSKTTFVIKFFFVSTFFFLYNYSNNDSFSILSSITSVL